MQMDTLDVLSEFLYIFGLKTTEPKKNQNNATLLDLLSHSRPAVRKRATVAIGFLVVHIDDDAFNALFTHLLESLNNKNQSNDKLRSFVQCAGVLR
jgi:cullin-associated NEDD8-dissociated protein 1